MDIQRPSCPLAVWPSLIPSTHGYLEVHLLVGSVVITVHLNWMILRGPSARRQRGRRCTFQPIVIHWFQFVECSSADSNCSIVLYLGIGVRLGDPGRTAGVDFFDMKMGFVKSFITGCIWINPGLTERGGRSMSGPSGFTWVPARVHFSVFQNCLGS